LIDPGFEWVKPDWLDFGKRKFNWLFLYGEDAKIGYSENFTSYFEPYDVIQLITTDYPLLLLYGNPYHKAWLEENFGMNAFSIVARRLMRLTPKVRKIYDEFRATKFGAHNIGIQMRLEKTRAKAETFAQVARLLQMVNFPNEANVTKFFLATDQLSVQREVKGYLGDSLIYVEPFRERYSNDSELYALVDMALLSSCDQLIITYKSSFGYVASAWQATTSYMIYHDNTYGALAMSDPCYWAMRVAFKEMPKNSTHLSNPVFLQQLRCHD